MFLDAGNVYPLATDIRLDERRLAIHTGQLGLASRGVAFLTSEEAGFVTGEVLSPNAGAVI